MSGEAAITGALTAPGTIAAPADAGDAGASYE
jgi:hypothetical protein